MTAQAVMAGPSRLREEWLRDDAGYPLGAGMPSGRPMRDDGQSHRAWWVSVLRADPCAYCDRVRSGTLDHIDPHSGRRRGGIGNWDWANFAGACAACNHRKSNESLLLFLARRTGTIVPAIRPAPACPPGLRRGPTRPTRHPGRQRGARGSRTIRRR